MGETNQPGIIAPGQKSPPRADRVDPGREWRRIVASVLIASLLIFSGGLRAEMLYTVPWQNGNETSNLDRAWGVCASHIADGRGPEDEYGVLYNFDAPFRKDCQEIQEHNHREAWERYQAAENRMARARAEQQPNELDVVRRGLEELRKTEKSK